MRKLIRAYVKDIPLPEDRITPDDRDFLYGSIGYLKGSEGNIEHCIIGEILESTEDSFKPNFWVWLPENLIDLFSGRLDENSMPIYEKDIIRFFFLDNQDDNIFYFDYYLMYNKDKLCFECITKTGMAETFENVVNLHASDSMYLYIKKIGDMRNDHVKFFGSGIEKRF